MRLVVDGVTSCRRSKYGAEKAGDTAVRASTRSEGLIILPNPVVTRGSWRQKLRIRMSGQSGQFTTYIPERVQIRSQNIRVVADPHRTGINRDVSLLVLSPTSVVVWQTQTQMLKYWIRYKVPAQTPRAKEYIAGNLGTWRVRVALHWTTLA